MKPNNYTPGQTYNQYKESVTSMIEREVRDLTATIAAQSLTNEDKVEITRYIIAILIKTL